MPEFVFFEMHHDEQAHVDITSRKGKTRRGFFAQARKGGIDMAALGAKLQARKKQPLTAIKQGGRPPPETRSFTGHKLKQGHVVEQAA